ncbi:4a-hydroxytetrahydrobiopterin dehydratase [Streptomyces ficellus]|uniref:4a-hydroxytetrahydrobiopterin dehydratase n=1 Tax=Streptomyces ficellus TaxID=1977088 RepID=UPI001FCC18E1|nr:4a-hydroxytetrahydrobiopterin dehydratase [Streptomyces ficellus]
MTVADPLSEAEIATHLENVPNWRRVGDSITAAYRIRYHGGVAMIVHVADIERLISHHADIDLRWDHVRFTVTTHDAGYKLTLADFDLAQRIDKIAHAHEAVSLVDD